MKIIFQIYLSFFRNIPTDLGVKLRFYAYKPFFKNVSGKFNIAVGVTILGFNNIELGKNVSIMKNSYLYANDNGSLIIGDNFSMNTNSQLGAASGEIIIGSNCLIGPNCVIRSANHNFSDILAPINTQGHKRGKIILENNVWIGANCVVTPNVTIGEGSVLAAGAVALKDIIKFSVSGGVPARVISKRV
ncbi:galactoside O-acetyltransferase [Lutibacter sp. Hel_I_33_5]|uniref:acyltransferase n=1 Tax=Lutibacter sp. Hel_I_33_5 TaxID=1566289 RepID=UPI00119CDFC7|nr:acyltransferase [Lutibacter sp. Hel_I_33_5]TVZ55502.1 galactoside O-acetyltransferase [Lutibacter sp. Hel_I_33_5]